VFKESGLDDKHFSSTTSAFANKWQKFQWARYPCCDLTNTQSTEKNI